MLFECCIIGCGRVCLGLGQSGSQGSLVQPIQKMDDSKCHQFSGCSRRKVLRAKERETLLVKRIITLNTNFSDKNCFIFHEKNLHFLPKQKIHNNTCPIQVPVNTKVSIFVVYTYIVLLFIRSLHQIISIIFCMKKPLV